MLSTLANNEDCMGAGARVGADTDLSVHTAQLFYYTRNWSILEVFNAPTRTEAHIIMRSMKGVIPLPATGYIQVHAYESFAQIPLQDVSVSVTATDGTAIALRLTDRSGRIDPIPIPVPERSESLAPNPGERPYTTVNLIARLRNYEQIFIDDLQVFADITTTQDLPMIPLSELPGSRNKSETFNTSRQNL